MRLKKIIAYALSAVFIAGVISFVSLYPEKKLSATAEEESETQQDGETQNTEEATPTQTTTISNGSILRFHTT